MQPALRLTEAPDLKLHPEDLFHRLERHAGCFDDLVNQLNCSLENLEETLTAPETANLLKLKTQAACLQVQLLAIRAAPHCVARLVALTSETEKPEVARRSAATILHIAPASPPTPPPNPPPHLPSHSPLPPKNRPNSPNPRKPKTCSSPSPSSTTSCGHPRLSHRQPKPPPSNQKRPHRSPPPLPRPHPPLLQTPPRRAPRPNPKSPHPPKIPLTLPRSLTINIYPASTLSSPPENFPAARLCVLRDLRGKPRFAHSSLVIRHLIRHSSFVIGLVPPHFQAAYFPHEHKLHHPLPRRRHRLTFRPGQTPHRPRRPKRPPTLRLPLRLATPTSPSSSSSPPPTASNPTATNSPRSSPPTASPSSPAVANAGKASSSACAPRTPSQPPASSPSTTPPVPSPPPTSSIKPSPPPASTRRPPLCSRTRHPQKSRPRQLRPPNHRPPRPLPGPNPPMLPSRHPPRLLRIFLASEHHRRRHRRRPDI